MPAGLPEGIKESCSVQLTGLDSLLGLLKGAIKKIPHWTNNEDEKLRHRGGFICLIQYRKSQFAIAHSDCNEHCSINWRHYTAAETINK